MTGLTLGCNSLNTLKFIFLTFWFDFDVLEMKFFFFTPFETANSSDLAKCGYIEEERDPTSPTSDKTDISLDSALLKNPKKFYIEQNEDSSNISTGWKRNGIYISFFHWWGLRMLGLIWIYLTPFL